MSLILSTKRADLDLRKISQLLRLSDATGRSNFRELSKTDLQS